MEDIVAILRVETRRVALRSTNWLDALRGMSRTPKQARHEKDRRNEEGPKSRIEEQCGGGVLSQMIWPYLVGKRAADNTSPGRSRRSQKPWNAIGMASETDQSTNTQQVLTTKDRIAAIAQSRGKLMGFSI